MIDPSLAAALARVADRANDVLHGYDPSFEPSPDVARPKPSLLPDLRPLATSPPPGSYFVVALGGRRLLTRDGDFQFERGMLRIGSGALVLGFPLGNGARNLAPLRVDAVDAASGHLRDPRIEPDGALTLLQTAIDPKTGVRRESRVGLGRVALASFPAATEPLRVDDHYVLQANGLAPRIGLPGDGTFAPLRTHVRELGRVDLEAGMRRLQEAYLSLEALRTAHVTRADLEKGAMDLLK